jgi:hypothetical protein
MIPQYYSHDRTGHYYFFGNQAQLDNYPGLGDVVEPDFVYKDRTVVCPMWTAENVKLVGEYLDFRAQL